MSSSPDNTLEGLEWLCGALRRAFVHVFET